MVLCSPPNATINTNLSGTPGSTDDSGGSIYSVKSPDQSKSPEVKSPEIIEVVRIKKYCRFKKYGIKYIDYKDPDFLLKFVNEQGKILPRRLTGTSLKYQRKLSVAIKRSRHLALMPYVADLLK